MQIWLEIIIRPIFLFFFTLFLVRIIGKKNILRATLFRFVSYTIIAVVTALLAVNVISDFVLGITALLVWVGLLIAMDYLAIKSKWVHDIIHGKETILVKHGKIMEENLLDVRLSAEELLRELRCKKIFNLADIEFAVLEDMGDINVLMKSHKTPLSACDLGIKVAPLTEPQTVILDGTILPESLASLGFNQEWLGIQLETIGVSKDNVFIGQVDSSGDLYLDLFDDSIQIPQPKVKEMLYANFEKSQADLMSFSLETQNKKASDMYSSHAEKIKIIMEKLEPYLLR